MGITRRENREWRVSTQLGHSGSALGTALHAPHLPFAILVRIGSVGCGERTFSAVAISLNGGWIRRPHAQKARPRSRLQALRQNGRSLGVLRRNVEEPEGIRPALQHVWRKVEDGMVGFVNVKTDYRARATTVRFSSRET
jgi:hypothetical protein